MTTAGQAGRRAGQSGATIVAEPQSLGVNLQVPEIAQTAITHICPDQGEIKKRGWSQQYTAGITCEIEDSKKSVVIICVSSYFHSGI